MICMDLTEPKPAAGIVARHQKKILQVGLNLQLHAVSLCHVLDGGNHRYAKPRSDVRVVAIAGWPARRSEVAVTDELNLLQWASLNALAGNGMAAAQIAGRVIPTWIFPAD
jgi:hypothetical protein